MRDNLQIRWLILHMPNQCTKFELCSLNCSRDILEEGRGIKI